MLVYNIHNGCLRCASFIYPRCDKTYVCMCVYVCTAMMSDRNRKFLKFAGCSVAICNNTMGMIAGVVGGARKNTHTLYVCVYIYI